MYRQLGGIFNWRPRPRGAASYLPFQRTPVYVYKRGARCHTHTHTRLHVFAFIIVFQALLNLMMTTITRAAKWKTSPHTSSRVISEGYPKKSIIPLRGGLGIYNGDYDEFNYHTLSLKTSFYIFIIEGSYFKSK